METREEILSNWILLLSFGYACGNSVSLTSDSGQNGQPLELKCQLTLTGTYNPFTVNWYLNNYSAAIERDALNCDPVSSPSAYDLSRYTFSCQTNVFTLTIKVLTLADNGSCWKCRVLFSDTTPTATASTCITVGQLALSLGLALGLGCGCIMSIFITLICCGCLDCCKCCRIFNHYQESKYCYMTCYCLEKGCCSFFYCRPGSKRGRFFCGRKSKNERCGGCYSCQKICGCGWPGFCRSKGPRSYGDCFCICCVAGMKDEALLDLGEAVSVHQQNSPAINGTSSGTLMNADRYTKGDRRCLPLHQCNVQNIPFLCTLGFKGRVDHFLLRYKAHNASFKQGNKFSITESFMSQNRILDQSLQRYIRFIGVPTK